MILAALLTSVGINVALCLIFFTVYSILRHQPSQSVLYLPRLVAEGKYQEENESGIRKFWPSVKWVKSVWQPSEEEILYNSGLDAVVFMRIFIFSFKVFRFAVIVGIFVLLPFNYLGSQLQIDLIDLPNKSLEKFSISNVNDGSNRLWIHFSAVYVLTAVVCYLLYNEFDYIASKRIEHFYKSKPQPNHFTVLVRSIPVNSERSFGESVEDFFSKYYGSSYLSHSMVRQTSKLKGLINEADKVHKKLDELKSKQNTEERFQRSCLGIFGRKVDLVDQYEKKLEDIEDNVRTERSSVVGKDVAAAFVSFKSRLTAAIVSRLQQGLKPTEWVTELAPEPQDVHWPFFSASFFRRWLCNVIVILSCISITILFLLPVVFVQGLTHLEQLEKWFPFLIDILEIKIVGQVITGYLPSLILQTFLSFVPPVMIMLSSIQGYTAFSQIEQSACIKVLWFTIWNVFFANVLSGTALYRVDVFLQPKRIPVILAVAVPAQASFFIAYVVTSGWTKTFSAELLQVKNVIWKFVKSRFCSSSNDEFEAPSNPYHSEIPRILFFILLGFTYFFLAPLILPFILVYLCIGYVIYRNQILNVFEPKFDTGGKFWPIIHDATIFSLILMHIIAIGIFGLKNVPIASSATIPLPILTLIFNSYCRRRFLPSFECFPAECLIQKDSLDRDDSSVSSFYEQLTNAYEDPSLKVRRYSQGNGRNTSPLLHGSQV